MNDLPLRGVFERFVNGPSSARHVTASKVAGAYPSSARHPHDLDDRIPGLSQLRSLTLGDPRITIVILDGDPDLTLSSLRSSRISKTWPYWHERAGPIKAEQYAVFRQIAESDLPREQKDEQLLAAFSPEMLCRIAIGRHATFLTSVIAGEAVSPAPGIAPNCRAIIVPLDEVGDQGELISPLNLARAFDLAHDLGADIIHCSICAPTQTDAPHELLAQTIRRCVDDNILVVAPAGNNAGECRCVPAVLPGTLAVGALRDNGKPFKYSNWGGNYSKDGVLAPGERIRGAQPGTEEPVREMGTSVAAPIVTGVAALLMSHQLQVGRQIDAAAIRAALLGTARPCDPALVDEPERCLRGVMNLPGAFQALFAPVTGSTATGGDNSLAARAEPAAVDSGVSIANVAARIAVTSQGETYKVAAPSAAPAVDPGSVEQSTAHSGLVFALGSLSYDFGSQIGVHEFEQYIGQKVRPGVPPTPPEVAQLIQFLERNPTERDCLIWTLMIDGAPVYGLVPDGPFDAAIYTTFLELLAGQSLAPDNADFVERISVPGRRTGKFVRLYSYAQIPIVAVTDLRGVYGWNIDALARDAVSRIYGAEASAASHSLHGALTGFLKRVYFDLHNLGQKSRDRAMNFAVTNLFQAASVFAQAIDEGRVLDTILVKQSPVCRMHSDCWDMSLTFFDPDDQKRAAKIFEFTIDVSETMPVTVGKVRSWFQRPK